MEPRNSVRLRESSELSEEAHLTQEGNRRQALRKQVCGQRWEPGSRLGRRPRTLTLRCRGFQLITGLDQPLEPQAG